MFLTYTVSSVNYGIGTPWSRPTETQALPRIKFVLMGGGGGKNEEHKTFIFISGSLCFTVLDYNILPQVLALPPNVDLVYFKH